MHPYPTLANAPITEALIDIQVRLHGEPTFEALEPFCDELADSYPNRRHRKEWRAQFKISGEEAISANPETGVVGYLLTSSDGSLIAQARLNGFSLSRLPPYESWDKFRSEAMRLWDIYLRVAGQVTVERIALRYVNRLKLPLPLGEFRQYIRTAPQIAPELPQSLSHFLMQVQIPSTEHDAIATITETIERPSEDGTYLPLLLDIETVAVGGFNGLDDSMWSRFEDLRSFKNMIFFASITEKTQELFR